MNHRVNILAALLAACLLCADSARAQTTPIYVSGGWALATRDAPEGRSDLGEPATLVQAITIGAGIGLRPWLHLEGTLQVQTSQVVHWAFSDIFGRYEMRTADRDAPLTALVRVGTFDQPISPQFVAGGGVSHHRGSSVMTADCEFSTSMLRECRPAGFKSSTADFEPLMVVGMDLPVRATARLSVAPSVRLLNVRRRRYLVDERSRGPKPGSGGMFVFGVTASWRLR